MSQHIYIILCSRQYFWCRLKESNKLSRKVHILYHGKSARSWLVLLLVNVGTLVDIDVGVSKWFTSVPLWLLRGRPSDSIYCGCVAFGRADSMYKLLEWQLIIVERKVMVTDTCVPRLLIELGLTPRIVWKWFSGNLCSIQIHSKLGSCYRLNYLGEGVQLRYGYYKTKHINLVVEFYMRDMVANYWIGIHSYMIPVRLGRDSWFVLEEEVFNP